MPPLLKTALVTGAARGIGLAIASRRAADEMRVTLLDLDPGVTEAAERTVGDETLALSADVTKGADVDAAVGRVVDHWGRLDVAGAVSTSSSTMRGSPPVLSHLGADRRGLAARDRRRPHQ
jgi:NAD(P)-dependent dehydrogenase (short-subunit alcohol dehydrogenase family)